MPGLNVLALNCTLKPSGESSSTDKLLHEVIAATGEAAETIRVADLNIKPGIAADQGEGDDWPKLLPKILACDLLIVGTPIWLGQPSSVAKRVMERMNAFLGEKDDQQRTPAYNKVAIVAVVGNEDGAHHSGAELCAALTEVGFTVPAGAATYWVGEALGGVDYQSLNKKPEKVANWTKMLASNAAHLASVLKKQGYPGRKSELQ
jgi:multimeric flavodoxin WrbA